MTEPYMSQEFCKNFQILGLCWNSAPKVPKARMSAGILDLEFQKIPRD